MGLDEEGMGWHSFKRFRKTWLRGARCLEDLNNFWMAHKPQTMSELYSHLHEELQMPLEEAERVGYGFDLPKIAVPPNAPKISASSVPWQTRYSAPRSSAARAPSALVTCIPTLAPAARIVATASFEGMPQENCTIGTPASSAALRDDGSLPDIGATARRKLTKKGPPLMAERTFETATRASSGLPRLASAPMAPAFETAMASSGQVCRPCGASKIGYFSPKSAIRAFARCVGMGIGDCNRQESTLGPPAIPTIAPAVVLRNSRLARFIAVPSEN